MEVEYATKSADYRKASREEVAKMDIDYQPEDIQDISDRLSFYYYPRSSPVSKSCIESTIESKKKLISDIRSIGIPIKNLAAFVENTQRLYFPFATAFGPVKYLGGGLFGKAYSVCNQQCELCVAIKIQIYRRGLESEVKMQNVFASLGLSIDMLDYKITRNDSGIEFMMTAMPVFETSLYEFLEKESLDDSQAKALCKTLVDMLTKISSNHLIHGDAHFGNIEVLDRRVYFIDFGRSIDNRRTKNPHSDMFIDMVQMIRSMNSLVVDTKNVVARKNGYKLYTCFCSFFESAYKRYRVENKYGKHAPDVKNICMPAENKYEDLFVYLLMIHKHTYKVE
jgi:tRNA A-37 threonylcarbamoyl transferase component Bud32